MTDDAKQELGEIGWNGRWDSQPQTDALKIARERGDELHGQLMRMIDRWEQQTDALKIAREALRNIQIEAEREQGSWVHLKRVIALNCKQTLAALEQSE
jgi:hypothetical protein